MITRIWQAWTSPQNAGTYEALLQTQIFPAVRAKGIQGLMHMELLRRVAGEDVEFIVLFRFADTASICEMTGGTIDEAYVPDAARASLKRFEDTARQFEQKHTWPHAKETSHVA